jgi:aminoglycoside phosphotransferase (APT) family kinase protein
MRDEKLRAGKFDVDVPLVQRLVASQFPQWAELPIRPVENDGWDNWTFHLGDRMKVRLPSAVGYSEQAEKEAHWLPQLASKLPLPVPVPVGIGRPAEDYPCAWSIYDWLDGEPVTREGVHDPVQFGWDLAKFIIALQAIDPSGGPPPGQHNYFRGAAVMAVYGDEARRSVDKVADVIDAPAAHAVLEVAEAAKITGPPVWIHGDIAAGNLLVRDGQLGAVIDFGGCAVGDPACDLVITWTFLEGAGREAFRLSVGGDDGVWARARGWALWKAALLLANGQVVNPNENSPQTVIEAVIADHFSAR